MVDHVDTARGRQATFVVRMWIESAASGSQRRVLWRGVIEHIQVGEKQAFEDLGRAFQFIEHTLEELTGKGTGQARR